MEMRTTSASAQSPVCSLIASKLRERIYAPHGSNPIVEIGVLRAGNRDGHKLDRAKTSFRQGRRVQTTPPPRWRSRTQS
jgi:hypothetical protein